MRKTIFNLEDKINIKDEYLKILKVLNTKCVIYNKKNYTYFDFVNNFVFNNWEYRGTYIDVYDYLDHIGINLKNKKISNNSFLNLLEFLLNVELFIEKNTYYSDNVIISTQCRSILQHNIYLILDNLGYEAYKLVNERVDRSTIINKCVDIDTDKEPRFEKERIEKLVKYLDNYNKMHNPEKVEKQK